MAIGSGLGSQVGYSVETTYSTYAAPTKFLRAKKYAATRTAVRVQGEGITAGGLGEPAAFYVETVNGGTGTLQFDVQTVLMGPLLQTLMGTSVTPTAVVTGSAYAQTHTLADTLGKSLTFQVGAPYRGGTVRPHTLTGVKVLTGEFTCDAQGILMSTFTLDAKAFTTTQTLASASYVASKVFRGGGTGTTGTMAVKTGTIGAETAVAGVRAVTCKIERIYSTDDYYTANNGQKSEPVLSGATKITGTITADWLDTAVFQDIADANSAIGLVLEWVDTVALSASNYPTFRITVPGVVIQQDTQGVDTRDVLQNVWNFEWKDNGTNVPVIYVLSSESAL